jgi:chemotaxis protein CheX
LEESYANPFIVGAKHVFKTMLDIDLAHSEPFRKAGRRNTAEVTGVMGFTGDRRGTMCVSMSASSALSIYTRLLNVRFDRITPEIIDAVGELTNIISGQARKELDRENLHLVAHVPMVFVGKDIEISFISKGVLTSIPFTFNLDGKTEEMRVDYLFE